MANNRKAGEPKAPPYQRFTESDQCPSWVSYNAKADELVIDADKVYPVILGTLGVLRPSKYWMGVCRRCATTYLRDQLNAQLRVRISGSKYTWWKSLPDGEGMEAGASVFRQYYPKVKARFDEDLSNG